MTWKSFHRRGETLRAVTAAADRRLDGRLPWDVDGVPEAFADELDLLGALQLRWHTRLSGHLEREVQRSPMDLERAVVTAWEATAAELPGIRAVLDRYRAEPLDATMAEALRTATTKEHTMLAVTAGLASARESRAARVGARLEQQARASWTAPLRHRGQHARPRLLDRLRSALAA